MKISIFFISFVFFYFFHYNISYCDNKNYINDIYNKNNNNIIKNDTIDEEIINFFKNQLIKENIINNTNYEIINIKISPNNIIVSDNNYDLTVINKPIILENGYVSLILNLSENGKKTKSIKVSGFIKIYKDLYCSAHPLSKNHIITKDDIIPCRVDLLQLKGTINDINKIMGKMLKFDIPGNRVFDENCITSPILIKRGDKVNVILQNSNITIYSSGEAMQSGSQGSVIRVRNTDTKKDITARILDSNTVQVVH